MTMKIPSVKVQVQPGTAVSVTRRKSNTSSSVLLTVNKDTVVTIETPVPSNRKRSVLNVDNVNSYDMKLIDLIAASDQWGPVGTEWGTGAVWNSAASDANGFPINSVDVQPTRRIGCGVRLWADTEYTGKYVLTWTGDGEVAFRSGGVWTVDAPASSGYAQISNGRYSGTAARIILTYTGPRQLIGLDILRTDRSVTGDHLRGLHMMRLDDEADYLAGKRWRKAYKDTLIAFNPAVVRYMSIMETSGSGCQLIRHQDRMPPSYASQACHYSLCSPPYGETVGVNQYTLGAAAGMSSSMTHGEPVFCRIGSGFARCGAKTVTAITNANPGVAQAIAHGFNTGDRIIHAVASGMTQLDKVPVTVTVLDQDHYSIGIDTSGYSAFTAGLANQYITLNVGGRGAYPVTYPDGMSPAGYYGNAYLTTREYKCFVFDATMVASTEINGAWIFSDLGNHPFGHRCSTSYELLAKLIVELNQETTRGPINVQVQMQHDGMLSMDPNYSRATNAAIGMVGVFLNGANGWPGLPENVVLRQGYGNETWNWANPYINAFAWLKRRAALRWNYADGNQMHALRSGVMVHDVLAAFPKSSRIQFVMEGQGTVGPVVGVNTNRIKAGANYAVDPLTAGWGDPMDHHDTFLWAHYFEASATFDANLLAMAEEWHAAKDAASKEVVCASYVNGGIRDPLVGETIGRYKQTLLPAYANAMAAKGKNTGAYEGDWNRSVWNAKGFTNSAVNPATDQITIERHGFTDRQRCTILTVGTLPAGLNAGEVFIVKDDANTVRLSLTPGGAAIDISGTSGSAYATHTIQPITDNFLWACKNSVAWSSAYLDFIKAFEVFDSAECPSVFVMCDPANHGRFGHNTVHDSLMSTYAGGVEFAGLDKAWFDIGAYNRGE